ncbi:hypothetical protein [Caballeronia sp. J97]|uniref:hypothetical protein n=1 Tax=Caballeronia sp. J97 TaxID=2805429 RepID=UPI002AB24B77|nr:hypothetical protein [Caballeronia sp. J97]
MVAPVTPVETGTPVDPGKASGDELQRHSMIPGSATGCRHAAGALSFLRCVLQVFPCCGLSVIDSWLMKLEPRQDFLPIKHSIQLIGRIYQLGNNTSWYLTFCALHQYYR